MLFKKDKYPISSQIHASARKDPEGDSPYRSEQKVTTVLLLQDFILNKEQSGQTPHSLFGCTSPAQVHCPGCLPSFQERNKHSLCTISMGQSGFVLILSIIHSSLPLQVPALKAELCFSYTSAQLHASFLSLSFKIYGNSNECTKPFCCGK